MRPAAATVLFFWSGLQDRGAGGRGGGGGGCAGGWVICGFMYVTEAGGAYTYLPRWAQGVPRRDHISFY
jgi:hypothetical protein